MSISSLAKNIKLFYTVHTLWRRIFMSEKSYTPILPFEDFSASGFMIYDNMTYYRDIDLTDKKFTDNHSDCMIKYYSTVIGEPIKIGGGY